MVNLLKRHVFNLTPNVNGGESLCLITEFFIYDDTKEVFKTQRIVLNSYSNSTFLNLSGIITPTILRELANELDIELSKVENDMKALKELPNVNVEVEMLTKEGVFASLDKACKRSSEKSKGLIMAEETRKRTNKLSKEEREAWLNSLSDTPCPDGTTTKGILIALNAMLEADSGIL